MAPTPSPDPNRGGVTGTPGVEHRTLTIQGHPLSCYVAGAEDAPPVVLLHGAMFDEARFIWDQLFPVLAARFRVHAIDTPRHGASRPWPGHLGHDRLVEVLDATVNQLGLDRFFLVGLSMGGGLALGFGARFPERVRAMVLFEPGGLGTRLPRQFLTWAYTRTPGLGRAATKCLHRQDPRRLRRTLDSLYVGGSTTTDPDRVLRVLRDEIDGKHRFRERDLDDWQKDAIGPWRQTWTVLDSVATISCPTLWLRGADSTLVTQEEMERAVDVARTAGSAATLRVIPGAGHMLPLERPALANAAVLEFLESQAAAPAS